jgi:hypothetical protein
VFVVLAALGASESLTNRTGRTATAVTVTFSEQVRITSYGSTTFPTQEPSSRADTFRFSGGQLENGARLSISWTPSTAEITNTEWETAGAASSGSTASSTPLTYEEIMAQIAQYPGPDEPLYVPAEGGQIWLTDLEGHADIYDNDSIKINYAPGFDKSQITRIDVYRNDVKMRLVPALFDVLTNDQMKTFDGNPAENTPASSHTDHAIMGYDYTVKFHDPSNQLQAVRTTTIKSTFRYHPEYIFTSLEGPWDIVLTGSVVWQGRGLVFDDDVIRQYFRELKSDGYNGIQLHVLMYADGVEAPNVFPVYREDIAKDPSLIDKYNWTVHPAELEKMLTLIADVGLQADVRVMLDPTDRYRAAHPDAWRGGVSPGSNPQAWFEKYFQAILPFVQSAEKCHAGYFCVFVENDLLMQYTEQMRWLLGAVDAAFSGAVYSAEGTGGQLHGGDWSSVHFSKFWDYDDTWIGSTFWPSNAETTSDQRYSAITTNMVNMWHPVVAHCTSSFPGHKLMWSEFGTYNSDGILSLGDRPFPSEATAVRDDQEVSDAYAAALAAASDLGYDGVCIWLFSMLQSLPHPLYISLDNLNARKVIRAIISP